MENLKYFHSTKSLPLESDEKNYWFKRKCSIQFTINKTHQNSVDSHWGIYQFVTILAEVDQTRDNSLLSSFTILGSFSFCKKCYHIL